MMLAFTTHSLTSAGDLPSGVTIVGGVVLDLIGKNGARVVSELKATDTFKGYFNSGAPTNYQGNPGTIGVQDGFDASIINELGGGLSEVAVRITLYDGDTGPGDFDVNENWLLVNGIRIGNFSDVVTHKTDASGSDSTATATKGFITDTLDTGFFYSNDSTFLNAFYQSLSQGVVRYQLDDSDSYDNYFDFTQGIDASLINHGQGPIVTYSLVNDSAATQAGKAIAIPVVANDNLPPAITNFAGLYIVSLPAHGTASIDHSTGVITYTPTPGFFGLDTFTYNFSDPGTNLAPATVQVNVGEVVNPFAAVDDVAKVSGSSTDIDVLANDLLPANTSPANLFITKSPAHGTVAIDPTTGLVHYTPNVGFFGNDVFQYRVSTLNPGADSATVFVTVANPFAAFDDVAKVAASSIDIDVLANDVLPTNTSPANLSITKLPAHGTVKIDPTTGLVRYSPNVDFFGIDVFQYRVSNLSPGADTATVFVTVATPAVIIVDKPPPPTTNVPVVDPTNGAASPPIAIIKQQLLLLTLPQPNIMFPSVPVLGAAGSVATKRQVEVSVGMPQVVDAAFGSDEVDKTALLTNFLDFVEPEALVVDLGDEPPAKISVDVATAAAVEVMKPTEKAEKPVNDAAGDQSHSGASTNFPYTTLSTSEQPPENKTGPIKPTAGSSFSSSLASNWKLLATGGAIALLAGAAWSSRTKWVRIARKLRWR